MEKTYQTKCLNESAFLYANHQKLLGLKKEGNYCLFVFSDKDGCEKLATVYWQSDTVVNVRDFINATKTLKDRLFSQKR